MTLWGVRHTRSLLTLWCLLELPPSLRESGQSDARVTGPDTWLPQVSKGSQDAGL